MRSETCSKPREPCHDRKPGSTPRTLPRNNSNTLATPQEQKLKISYIAEAHGSSAGPARWRLLHCVCPSHGPVGPRAPPRRCRHGPLEGPRWMHKGEDLPTWRFQLDPAEGGTSLSPVFIRSQLGCTICYANQYPFQGWSSKKTQLQAFKS
jgi:hypothetical protein